MKILYTLPALDGGGIDKIIYDYSIRLPNDTQCDFIVHTDYEGILENDLVSKGYKIFHVPPLHKDRKKYFSDIDSIIKKGNYDIIHVNQGFKGAFFLAYAKKHGVKVRIAHAHTSYIPENFKSYLIRKAFTLLSKMMATDLFACGQNAARWMWGERAYDKGRVFLMANAIDAERFAFSKGKREELRRSLGIEDKLVLCNVARFSDEKNHSFLVDVLSEIKKIQKDSVLVLIGRGDLEKDIKKKVSELKLDKDVLFLGVRNDVPDLLNAMDVFVLPSFYEGLPVTLIEAQANGLPAVISDAVTKEMAFSDDFSFLSLSQSAAAWADVTVKKARTDSKNLIENTPYDLRVATDAMLEKYKAIYGDINN